MGVVLEEVNVNGVRLGLQCYRYMLLVDQG